MSAREVRPLLVPPGDAVLDLLPLLATLLDGDGPAWLPVASNGPAADQRLLGPLAPDEDDSGDPTALVVSTSGSTGDPKAALLPVSALRASVASTHDRLSGPGVWLLALPAQHIAGLQVLMRSVLAETTPVVMDLRKGFSPNDFVTATRHLGLQPGSLPRYTSLVPTQLNRLLDAGGHALEALSTYDAVLVGGAATSPAAIERAEKAGVAVVTTYGMSETCGGCVYDGRPLAGVWWRTEDGGRVELTGAVLARGYRGRPADPAFRTEPDGVRWFRTDDIGEAGPDGRLQVLGRGDDVIVTGGLKVAPAVVEAALGERPDVRDVVVVGVPDEVWGERVVAVVVPADGATDLGALQRWVTDAVASYAAPRQLVLVDEIPLIGPGKPDRAALRSLARQRQGRTLA